MFIVLGLYSRIWNLFFFCHKLRHPSGRHALGWSQRGATKNSAMALSSRNDMISIHQRSARTNDFKSLCHEWFYHVRHHVHDSHCTGEFATVIWLLDSFTIFFRGNESGLRELTSVNRRTPQWARGRFTKTIIPARFEKWPDIKFWCVNFVVLRNTMYLPYWWCTKHAKLIKYGDMADPILPISCLVMSCILKSIGHQQAWYWPNKAICFVSSIKKVNITMYSKFSYTNLYFKMLSAVIISNNGVAKVYLVPPQTNIITEFMLNSFIDTHTKRTWNTKNGNAAHWQRLIYVMLSTRWSFI